MTPAETILGKLSQGPSTSAILATELQRNGVSLDNIYIQFFETIQELINAKKVEQIPSINGYRLMPEART